MNIEMMGGLALLTRIELRSRDGQEENTMAVNCWKLCIDGKTHRSPGKRRVRSSRKKAFKVRVWPASEMARAPVVPLTQNAREEPARVVREDYHPTTRHTQYDMRGSAQRVHEALVSHSVQAPEKSHNVDMPHMEHQSRVQRAPNLLHPCLRRTTRKSKSKRCHRAREWTVSTMRNG